MRIQKRNLHRWQNISALDKGEWTMAIEGKYYIKKWIPNAELVHKDEPPRPKRTDEPERPAPPAVELRDYGTPPENFFEGDMTSSPRPRAFWQELRTENQSSADITPGMSISPWNIKQAPDSGISAHGWMLMALLRVLLP